jgi:hypothetical protein
LKPCPAKNHSCAAETIESSNSFREFETFADDLANLGADIMDIYMIYIYMSPAVWLHWVLIHWPAAKALARKHRFGNCDM